MNFKTRFLQILIASILINSVSNICCVSFSINSKVKKAAIILSATYLLHKFTQKEEEATVNQGYLSDTLKTEEFLSKHLQHETFYPEVFSNQKIEMPENIRENILGNLVKYNCFKTFIHKNFFLIYRLRSACMLPDGHLVTSSGGVSITLDPNVGDIKIWNINPTKCIKTLNGSSHSFGRITGLCVLPNGNFVSASVEGTIKIWNFETYNCSKTYRLYHNSLITSICCLSDENIAISSISINEVTNEINCEIKIWNINTGACLRTLTGHTSEIFKLINLPNGNLASASFDKTIRIWNPYTGECIRILEGHTDMVTSICCLIDGRLISGSLDGTIRIWDIESGKFLLVSQNTNQKIISLCVLPNGNLVSAYYNQSSSKIRIWNINSGDCIQELNLKEGKIKFGDVVSSICVLSNNMFASCTYSGKIKIWGKALDIAHKKPKLLDRLKLRRNKVFLMNS